MIRSALKISFKKKDFECLLREITWSIYHPGISISLFVFKRMNNNEQHEKQHGQKKPVVDVHSLSLFFIMFSYVSLFSIVLKFVSLCFAICFFHIFIVFILFQCVKCVFSCFSCFNEKREVKHSKDAVKRLMVSFLYQIEVL